MDFFHGTVTSPPLFSSIQLGKIEKPGSHVAFKLTSGDLNRRAAENGKSQVERVAKLAFARRAGTCLQGR